MDVTDLSASFAGRVFHIPGLANRSELSRLAEEALEGPCSRVTLGNTGLSWEERPVQPDSELWTTMQQDFVTQLVTQALGTQIRKMMAWTNVYAAGERIPWHKDSCGDIQLLLVVAASDPEAGGLWLESRAGPRRIPLPPGDAILFTAARIRHQTSATVALKEPRITAAMRFFAVAA